MRAGRGEERNQQNALDFAQPSGGRDGSYPNVIDLFRDVRISGCQLGLLPAKIGIGYLMRFDRVVGSLRAPFRRVNHELPR
jgi:hypothetical protein